MPDFEALAKVAHDNGIPLVVDNTFGAAGYLSRPIDFGADIVVASATKWIGGHGTSIGGVIVDAGTLRLGQRQVPGVHRAGARLPRPQVLGDVRAEGAVRQHRVRDPRPRRGPARLRAGAVAVQLVPVPAGARDAVAARAAPQRQRARAREVAGAAPGRLVGQLPEPASHPSHALAKKYLRNGFGSVLTFGIQGGREAGRRFIDSVKLASHLANVGDAKTLVIHPASTTHQQLSDAEQKATGVTPDLVRVSVGIEHIEDIKADFQQAFDRAVKAAA